MSAGDSAPPTPGGQPDPPGNGPAAEVGAGETRLPLTEHLEELRSRVIRSLVAVGIGAAVCYAWKEDLYGALLSPLLVQLPPDSHLIFTELTEAFLTYFKVALLGGFVLASPVVSYQIWRFVSPGLYRKERSIVLAFSLWSTIAFLGGMAFAYFFAIPGIFSFLMSFGRSIIVPMPSMKDSLALVLRTLLIFGAMFELPLVLYLGGRAGILSPDLLRRGRGGRRPGAAPGGGAHAARRGLAADRLRPPLRPLRARDPPVRAGSGTKRAVSDAPLSGPGRSSIFGKGSAQAEPCFGGRR